MPSLFHKHFHLAKSRSFYVVHHFGFLDSLLNSEEHCLKNCTLDKLLPRSDTMAEREPLLPRQNRPGHQHSIFQLVCHSPWYYIGQRSLLFARGFLALYLSAVLGLAVYYVCTPGHRRHAKFFPFYGSTISFAIQVIYYWITAVCCRPKDFHDCSNINFQLQIWTFDHLVGAHSQLPPREQAKGRVLAHMQNVFSIPKNTNVNSKKRLAFSLFYSAATTFPLVVTTTYWLYLFPADFQPDPPTWPRLLQYFVTANFYIINSIIAVVEVMLLSSVQKQKVAKSLPCRIFTDLHSR